MITVTSLSLVETIHENGECRSQTVLNFLLPLLLLPQVFLKPHTHTAYRELQYVKRRLPKVLSKYMINQHGFLPGK